MTNSLTVYCEADISYLTSEPRSVRCVIYDGRQADLDFHQNGFELRHLPSAVADWADEAEIERVYYPELSRFCKDWLGCQGVFFLQSLYRHTQNLGHDLVNSDQGPLLSAHSDYTEKYWDMIGDESHSYAKALGPSMEKAGISYADVRAASRVVLVQFWRNFGAPRMDYPLALGDTRSAQRADFVEVPVEVRLGPYMAEFEALALTAGPANDGPARHTWYTFTDMTADEVILFRGFDSERIRLGEPYCVPHTAFRDPKVPEGMHRASLESRAICLF